MTKSLDLNVINHLRRNAVVKSIFTTEDDTMCRYGRYDNLEVFTDCNVHGNKVHKNKLYLISYHLHPLLRVFFNNPSLNVVKSLDK